MANVVPLIATIVDDAFPPAASGGSRIVSYEKAAKEDPEAAIKATQAVASKHGVNSTWPEIEKGFFADDIVFMSG
jgi:hypothetical protein